MASAGRKVIVVFGATGSQGGSVVRALKGDEKFHVKAVTRNPDSDKAKALHAQGIEVIKADMDDVESIKPVLQGAYGAFLITNYWEHLDKDRELQQARNVIDVAKQFDVQNLVYSGTFLNSDDVIEKKAKELHAKILTREYIKQQGIPCTVVQLATYFENLVGAYKPRKNDKGEYVLDFPMGGKPLDMVCVAEVGECIRQMFVRPDEFKGQNIGLSSQKCTMDEYAAILSRAIDTKTFVAGNMNTEQCSKLGFPGAEEIATMFELFQKDLLEYDTELTHRLNPNMPTFDQWVDRNRETFNSVLD